MPGTETDHHSEGSQGAAISNAVVRLLSEYTGRGPTRARTFMSDELISVVVHDTLTKGERSLVRDGLSEVVLSTRKAYQATMREEFIAAVERISGRSVLAFMSDNHIDPDAAVESFIMGPDVPPA